MPSAHQLIVEYQRVYAAHLPYFSRLDKVEAELQRNEELRELWDTITLGRIVVPFEAFWYLLANTIGTINAGQLTLERALALRKATSALTPFRENFALGTKLLVEEQFVNAELQFRHCHPPWNTILEQLEAVGLPVAQWQAVKSILYDLRELTLRAQNART